MSVLAMLQSTTPDQQQQINQAMAMVGPMLGFFFLVWLVFVAFAIFCFWRIFTRAGFAGPLSLLILVPGFGPLIVICILAFGEWKVVPAPTPAYPPYPQQFPPQA